MMGTSIGFSARLTLLGILLSLLSHGAVSASAQDTAARDQSVGAGSLPVWSRPAADSRASLSGAVQELRGAVFLVGSPQAPVHGTAFAISKKHRLLVTNAHVADLASRFDRLMVILNGTATTYPVEKIYYHPGVMRFLGNTGYKVGRVKDPAVGPVYTASADLALLQLSAQGPDLPAEIALATPEECYQAFGQPVGMIGFPGHSGGWPVVGDVAQATYHDGVISRVTDFQMKSSASQKRLQFLQHTIQNFGGFSGSPLFLPNGRAIAVNNSGRGTEDRGILVNLSWSIRSDCIWEMIAYHDLGDLVPIPAEKASLDLDRFDTPDPSIDNFLRAMELVNEARRLNDAEKHSDAVKKCNEALGVSKEYADSYSQRARAYVNYVASRKPPSSTAVQMYDWAVNDMKKFQELAPSDPRGPLLLAGVIQFRTAYVHRNNPRVGAATFREVEQLTTRVLRLDRDDPKLKAEAYGIRAAARHALFDSAGALADYNMVIQLFPTLPQGYYNRADFWEIEGQSRQAEADRRRARELQ